VQAIVGDRNKFDDFQRTFSNQNFDVVIDMICFNPDQAENTVNTFAGRCEQFIFCSTVCTYGVKVPSSIFIDESFPQEPISGYGRNKVACEKIFLAAHAADKFKTTIIRPSHTYGQGNPLIDNLEPDPVSWDRIERGKPILCSGDGLGLWVSTHRDDCGKLFAYAAMNPKHSANPTTPRATAYDLARLSASGRRRPEQNRQSHFYAYRLDRKARSFSLWLAARNHAFPRRLRFFKKPKATFRNFNCEIDFPTGVKLVMANVRDRYAWKDSSNDKALSNDDRPGDFNGL